MVYDGRKLIEKGHLMSAEVTHQEIEDAVRRNINTFDRHDLLLEEDIVEEVTGVIQEDLQDGSWFLNSFTALIERWDDGTDHFGFIEDIADVYREFYCEDLVRQVIRHYHNPLLRVAG